jgi:hypothetical protein
MNHEGGLILSRDLVANTEAAQLLRRIREWISMAKPICLVHPLGFCVVLLHKNDYEEWRFHGWPKGVRKITGMPGFIHTHNKVVESKILKGELSNVIYSVEEVARGGTPVYEVEYFGNRYVSSATNVLVRSGYRVEPTAISDQLIRTDQSYTIPAHVFHQADVSESISVATLVCMHSAAPGTIKVIGLDGYSDRIEFQRPRCSAIEAASA